MMLVCRITPRLWLVTWPDDRRDYVFSRRQMSESDVIAAVIR